MKKKKLEPKCKNCLLYDHIKGECKVAILIDENLEEKFKQNGILVETGQKINLPVFPEDNCHMEELGIPVEQVRWWVEDPKTGKPTSGEGVVKFEYPENFFGKKPTKEELKKVEYPKNLEKTIGAEENKT